MNIVAIIPARMGSSRFPGKPLAPILGMPMIGHVYLRSAMSDAISSCWVATCDQEIVDYVESIGGKAVMTADTHERASDRCAEAMLKIEEQTGQKIDVVVMVQGDEPLVTPSMITTAVKALQNSKEAGVACLMGPITDYEDFIDPNEIKVVAALDGKAVYMSREPIPTNKRGATEGPWLKQICIIPFTREYLLKFNDTPPTHLEIAESIDLNRCLECGHVVQMAMTEDESISVDTPDDLKEAEKALSEDALAKTYMNEPLKKSGT